MHTIARERGEDEKLIRLVVQEYIHCFIQDEKRTISVKGDAGKTTGACQEADQQVETPTGARHAQKM